MLVERRWYQEEAEQSIFNYFMAHLTGNPVVAMPTGTGKSHVIAKFAKRALHQWPLTRLMMLTHVKELITQNASKMLEYWPHAPLGIYSAGLKSRDTALPIIFGGVKSVLNAILRAEEEQASLHPNNRHFGWRDLLLIDECHLLSPEDATMYQAVIRELMKINPRLRVIGFTATPYRLKQGMLTDGGLFTDVCFDITGLEAFNRLIAEGYLSPVFARPTTTQIDLSEVSILGGEYNQKEAAAKFDKFELVQDMTREICEKGHDRKSWLIFASSIEHAEHFAGMFQSFGVSAAASHSKLKAKENDDRIAAFKSGEIRALVNMGKFTTGFDHPGIDLIGMCRKTMSASLWVQMAGRGTRPSRATGKNDCLLLDFAGNAKQLGAINDPKIPRKPGAGGSGDMPVKLCPNCRTYNHAAARSCECCGEVFNFATKLFATSFDTPIIAGDIPQVEVMEVTRVLYTRHDKRDAAGNLVSNPMMKVTYCCGLYNRFDKYVGLEHKGKFLHDSREWWRMMHGTEPPMFTYQALEKTGELRNPRAIRVHVNKKYPEILGYEF